MADTTTIEWTLLHHTLIGRRVEWRGDLWTVTGARREDGISDVAFRLLPLNANIPREEVWTEPRPTFGARSHFDIEQHLETLPARAAGYVRRAMAEARVDPRCLMPAERECCGTFQGSRHRATCDGSKPEGEPC